VPGTPRRPHGRAAAALRGSLTVRQGRAWRSQRCAAGAAAPQARAAAARGAARTSSLTSRVRSSSAASAAEPGPGGSAASTALRTSCRGPPPIRLSAPCLGHDRPAPQQTPGLRVQVRERQRAASMGGGGLRTLFFSVSSSAVRPWLTVQPAKSPACPRSASASSPAPRRVPPGVQCQARSACVQPGRGSAVKVLTSLQRRPGNGSHHAVTLFADARRASAGACGPARAAAGRAPAPGRQTRRARARPRRARPARGRAAAPAARPPARPPGPATARPGPPARPPAPAPRGRARRARPPARPRPRLSARPGAGPSAGGPRRCLRPPSARARCAAACALRSEVLGSSGSGRGTAHRIFARSRPASGAGARTASLSSPACQPRAGLWAGPAPQQQRPALRVSSRAHARALAAAGRAAPPPLLRGGRPA